MIKKIEKLSKASFLVFIGFEEYAFCGASVE